MSSKGVLKKAKAKPTPTKCKVCEENIVDSQESSAKERAMGGRCTGLTRAVMESYGKSSKPFQCANCKLEVQSLAIEELQKAVKILEAKLNGVNINDNAVSINDTQAAQGTQQTNIQTHRNRSQEHDKGQSKKFTFVVYGIKECQQGSTRLTRSTNDIKEVSDTVARIDPEFSSKSI